MTDLFGSSADVASSPASDRPSTVTLTIVAVTIRLRLNWSGDQIESIEPTTTLDHMRDRAIAAVNMGLKNGRQLQHQALQALAIQELIAGLIRTQGTK